jgi:hypothetical protein
MTIGYLLLDILTRWYGILLSSSERRLEDHQFYLNGCELKLALNLSIFGTHFY